MCYHPACSLSERRQHGESGQWRRGVLGGSTDPSPSATAAAVAATAAADTCVHLPPITACVGEGRGNELPCLLGGLRRLLELPDAQVDM